MQFGATNGEEEKDEARILNSLEKIPQFVAENTQQEKMKHRMNVDDSPNVSDNKEPS